VKYIHSTLKTVASAELEEEVKKELEEAEAQAAEGKTPVDIKVLLGSLEKNQKGELGREDIFELGARSPYARNVSFPTEVTADFEVTSVSGDQCSTASNGSHETNEPVPQEEPEGVLAVPRKKKEPNTSKSSESSSVTKQHQNPVAEQHENTE
jgi:hypothetical protein